MNMKRLLSVLALLILLTPLSSVWSQAPVTCRIDGPIYDAFGQPDFNMKITIRNVEKSGVLITRGPVTYKTDRAGNITRPDTLRLIQGATAWIEAPIGAPGNGFNVRGGVQVLIPVATSEDLVDLMPASNLASTNAGYVQIREADGLPTKTVAGNNDTSIVELPLTLRTGTLQDTLGMELAKLTFETITTSDSIPYFDTGSGTWKKSLYVDTGAGGGEANTISSLGGEIALTAVTPKSGVDLRTKSISSFQFLTNADSIGLNISNTETLFNHDNLLGFVAGEHFLQSAITTTGTIGTGVWQGTVIGVTYGGTGANLSATGGANQFVRQSSSGGAFTVSALADADVPDHTSEVTGGTALTIDKTIAPTWTGLHTFNNFGTGNFGADEYDLRVATNDTAALMRIGNLEFGTSSDLLMGGGLTAGGATWFISQNAPDGIGEFFWINAAGALRFGMPINGRSYGTYNPRGFIIAGPAVYNDSVFVVDFWGGNRLAMDTDNFGADLFVQNNVQVGDTAYVDNVVLVGGEQVTSRSDSTEIKFDGITATGTITGSNLSGTNTGDEALSVAGTPAYVTVSDHAITRLAIRSLWVDSTGVNGLVTNSTLPAITATFTNKTLDDFTNDIDADRLHIEARNASGATINIGDAIYISGYNVGQNLIEVSLADASVAGTMPAVGLVESSSIANNANGEIVISGRLSGIDASSFSVGDNIYISETGTTGNTLTATKPTGTALVQSIGEILRSHATLGIIEIFGAGRSNDLPNIASANFWLGNGSGVPTPVTMSGEATMDNAGAIAIQDIFLRHAGDTMVGNILMSDGAGASPFINFAPGTGTQWSMNVEDAGDDFQVTTNTGATEEFDFLNSGAGVIDVNVDGVLIGARLRVPNSTTLPATCTTGDQYMDTDATSGQRLFLCEATNSWVLQGDGTGGGSPLATQFDGVEQASDTQIYDIDTNDFTLTESPANDFDWQLNANVVQTNQVNVFGDFDQSFRNNRLRISNPANTFFYSITGSAIVANRILTVPLLTTGDTFTFNAFAATLTNKSIDSDNNTITNIVNADIKAAAGIIYSKLTFSDNIAVEDVQPELDNRTLSYSIIDTVKALDLFRIHEFNYAITIDSVVTNTDAGTHTFNVEHRAHTTPRSAGTDVLTADIVADAYESSSTFADNTIPANRPLYHVGSAAAGGADRCDVTIFYKID